MGGSELGGAVLLGPVLGQCSRSMTEAPDQPSAFQFE